MQQEMQLDKQVCEKPHAPGKAGLPPAPLRAEWVQRSVIKAQRHRHKDRESSTSLELDSENTQTHVKTTVCNKEPSGRQEKLITKWL